MKYNKLLVMCSVLMASNSLAQKRIAYPITEKGNIVDEYFGVKIADPYRWLENDTSKVTAQWVNAQNNLTNSYLERIPFRKALKERMMELYNYEKISAPILKNGKYYFSKNNGLLA